MFTLVSSFFPKDCPELLRRRIAIAQAEISSLRRTNKNYKQKEKKAKEQKESQVQRGMAARVVDSSRGGNLGDDDEEVLDGDTLMARLGFRL